MKKIFVLIALIAGAISINGLFARASTAKSFAFVFDRAEKIDPVVPTSKLVKQLEDLIKSVPPVENTVAAVAAAVPVKEVSEPKPVAPDRSANPSHPVHLTIPKARVDANVIPVGVTETNNLDVPPNYVEVGWYKYGTVPGEVGSAVLDGHVDDGYSLDGVFKHLRDLREGDEIFVTAQDGSTKKFIVKHSDVYALKAFPSNLVFNDKSGKLLKLITCHGAFVPSMNTYNQRLIITAELAE